MRLRTSLIAMLVIVLLASISPMSIASTRAHHSIVLAQDEGTDSDQGESGDEAGKGQKDPEAETDPGKGEEAAEGEEEEGPPWTYQMARLSIGLIVLLAAVTALRYRKMIGTRQKARA